MSIKSIFLTYVLLSSVYHFVLGWLIVAKNRKILDIYTIIILQFIKIFRGPEISDRYKSNILTYKNFKVVGINYIVGSIAMAGIAALFL